ncbi:UDP-glucose/GDP-mannose dehydrogenase family protein [Bacillus timonensis]|nr:UDP-glucose/GDP-mannose dehydrogenase family protein [Bacillus timonensis]
MNVCVIGAGYVGLTTSAVLAELGHHVTCVDIDQKKIDSLKKGNVPIYEPGLEELLLKNKQHLLFSTNVEEIIKASEVVMIAVGTPSLYDGSTDLTYILSVVNVLARTISTYTTIVTKSTVPPGTNEKIKGMLIQKGLDPALFAVVSNPEFLREGSAVKDMFHPDKTVIGVETGDQKSVEVMRDLYKGISAPFLITNYNGAEMIKYASNGFLATKISFINEISRICEAYNADVAEVAKGIGMDPRISPHFLQAGIGFGGSCFPKDVSSLIYSATKKNVDPLLLRATQAVNHTQVEQYVKKLKKLFPKMEQLKIAVLGVAFKPNTDDIRYSPAVSLSRELADLGSTVTVYDPKALLPESLAKKVLQVDSVDTCIKDCDCVFVATDWEEFKQLDWQHVKQLMKGDIIVDGRNCLVVEDIEKQGLQYIGVGRL